MFDHRHYVPLLKWKRGEYRALRFLDKTVRQHVTPLCDFPPVKYDPSETGGRDPAFDDRLSRLATQIEDIWGSADRVFLDLGLLDPDAKVRGTAHPVSFVFDDARNRGLQLVPVTGPNRDPNYQASVAEVVATDKCGVCLRVHFDEFEDENLASALDEVFSKLNVSAEDCDLIIDLQSVIGMQLALLTPSLISLLSGLSYLSEWRSLTVATGAFPQDLTAMTLGPNVVPRRDWALWKGIIEHKAMLPRLPTYGDYGVVHPELLDLDMSTINVSASVRYTTDTHWLVMRGRGLRTRGSGGYAQYMNHAASLIARPEFSGSGFSAGDQEIADIAAGKAKRGNPETWLRIGTNHHLTFVVRQIASLFAPSTGNG